MDTDDAQYMQACGSQHETVNRLFKQFNVINNRFKRDVMKHGVFTYAIANIIQVGIMFGEMRPYDVPLMEPESWREKFRRNVDNEDDAGAWKTIHSHLEDHTTALTNPLDYTSTPLIF